jgi:hypothetical protein
VSRKVLDLPRTRRALARLGQLARDHPEAFDLDRLPTTPRKLSQAMKRPGRGRPLAADLTVAVTARLPRSVVETLDALLRERQAAKPGITRQDLLREAVGRFLAAERRKAGKAGVREHHAIAKEET